MGKKNSYLFLAFSLVLALFFIMIISCSASPLKNRDLVEVSLGVDEEKYLTHVYLDGITKHTYEAKSLTKTGATGETSGESLLVLNSNGIGAIGYLEPGLWSFTVRAYNKEGTLVYEGKSNANISENNNTASVVLALKKEGDGTISFTLSSRCIGSQSTLVATWESYDKSESGMSSDFDLTCDGLTDIWRGTVSVKENRYKVTLKLITDSTTLSSDVTDLLVLNGSDTAVSGVLDGQENPSGTLKPIAPVIPKGYISLKTHAVANKKNTLIWNSDLECTVTWYIDGTEVGKGKEKEVTLPSPGMHNVSAVAVYNDESYSDTLILNLCSQPLSNVGGFIVLDKGESYGEYWFDEGKEVFRRLDDLKTTRYLVYWDCSTKLKQTYTYDEAIKGDWKNALATDGYRLPTMTEAKEIQKATKGGTVTVPNSFWTSTEYNNTYAYMAEGSNSIKSVGKANKASIVLVKEI